MACCSLEGIPEFSVPSSSVKRKRQERNDASEKRNLRSTKGDRTNVGKRLTVIWSTKEAVNRQLTESQQING